MGKVLRITEEQLAALIKSTIRENNYPAGAEYDINAPWNKETLEKIGDTVSGSYIGVAYGDNEYLFKNTKTGEFVYTNDNAWETFGNRAGIVDALYDFLDVPMVNDGGEQVPEDEWEGNVTDEQKFNALVSYLNNNEKRGIDSNIGTLEDWEDGVCDFIVATPENISDVSYDERIISTVTQRQ